MRAFLYHRLIKALAFLFIALITLNTSSAQNQGAKSNGLISYWTFDNDNANDTYGSNHGSIIGSNISFVNGVVGRALQIAGNGTDSYVEIPSINTGYITVEAWVNSTKYGYYTSFITKKYFESGWNPPYAVWQLWLAEDTDKPGVFALNYTISLPSPESVPMNTWFHIAFTYDGTDAKLYINGVEKGSSNVNYGPLPSTDAKVYLGYTPDCNHSFTGMIDEVAIWDNALSASEIQQHYQNSVNGVGYTYTGLVASYPFNGNVNDESGNGNNGIDYNGLALTTDRYGESNHSYSFDGMDDYVYVPHSASLNFSGEITVSAWINPARVDLEQQSITSKGGGWNRAGWLLTLNNNKVRWHLGNGATEGMFDTEKPIEPNKWTHVVALWKDGTMNVYINGAKDNYSASWASGLVANAYDLYIGKTDNVPFQFNGMIDDVQIYSKALTDTEILELYANYYPPQITAFTPLLHQNRIDWENSNYLNLSKVKVYRNGSLYAEVTVDGPEDNVFNDYDVASGQHYQYYITSVDKNGVESIPSSTVEVTSLEYSNTSVTLMVNMNYQISNGLFIPGTDYVDVAGTFNGWTGSGAMSDPESDGIYAITIDNLTIGLTYEYKFRKNGSWNVDSHEFPGGNNRWYVVRAGENIINHWYKDEAPVGEVTQPIADYRFNGNAIDYSEQRDHGWERNGLTPTSDRFGNENAAFNFDGIDDYISTDSIIVPVGGNGYSISLWFNANTLAGTLEFLSQWTNANANNSFFLGLENQNIRFSDSWSSVPVGGLQTGKWYHMVAISASDNAYLYLNGALVATKGSALAYTGLASFVIGQQGDLNMEYFNGKLDDIKIYNRILTPDEINTLYGNFYALPIVTTTSPWNINQTMANVGGSVTADGGSAVTEFGIYYGTLPDVVNTGTKQAVGSGVQAFGITITGLTPGTTYYVRAYATNGNGTAYGEELSFTTAGSNQFAGGTGTEADPFLVETAEHLNNVRLYLGPENANVYFRQTMSIDLGGSPWSDGNGWEPIGNGTNAFYGKYDGNSNSITGLTINRSGEEYIGLFGRAVGARLTNIRLENVNIIGYRRVGALIGQMRDNGYIANCSASGEVQGQVFAAGLVGNLYYSSTLEFCQSSVNVKTISGDNNQQIGGLIGRLLGGYVYNSYATGNVEGAGSWTGGLIGLATEFNYSTGTTTSNVANCYATGSVSGEYYVGGLLGGLQRSNLSNSYSVGKVSANSSGGGLVGYFISDNSTVLNNYWNIETSGMETSPTGEGKTTLEMVYPWTFTAWDFATTWNQISGSTYPYLQWQGTIGAFNYPVTLVPPSNLVLTPGNGAITLSWRVPSIGNVTGYNIYRDGSYYTTTNSTTYTDYNVTNYTTYNYYVTVIFDNTNESGASNSASTFPHAGFGGGDGSVTNPYLILSAEQLYTVRLYLSSHFRQEAAEISLGTFPWNGNEGWQPIGSIGKPFTGSYNGNGMVISGLTISRAAQDAVGLFGQIDGASIYDLTLTGANVSGRQYVGLLAGDVNNSMITNVATEGYVSAQNYAGGIAGYNLTSNFSKSHSTGTITATGNWIGGIAGISYNSSNIERCYSNMNISSSGYSIGGISGSTELKSSISNSYFRGSISGDKYLGGVSGWLDSSYVSNCYSTAFITGNGEMGGLVGSMIRHGEVISSYWDTQTSGQNTSVAGGEGRTTDDMTFTYSSNTYVGWDFTNIWIDDNGYTVNNGYPYLRSTYVNAPTVETLPAENITPLSATVTGNVTSDGGAEVTTRGICWSTSPSPTIADAHSENGTGTGLFTVALANLAVNTTYYARAYATNTIGTTYGNQITFTTLNPGTKVYSLIGQGIYLPDDATICNWNCDNDFYYLGTSENTSSYRINSQRMEWGAQFKVRQNHNWIDPSYGIDEVTITGDPNNFYKVNGSPDIFVRIGKVYEITFMVDWVNNTYTLHFNTLSPTIETINATSVEAFTAVAGGNVVSEGSSSVTDRGICLSTSHYPTINDIRIQDGNLGVGSYSLNITGLAQSSTYFIRAYATNGLGTFYGNEETFTTRAAYTEAYVTSDIYTISNFEITNVINSETLQNFKNHIFPSTGAWFEVYQYDGMTVATDLQTGYLVKVTSEDGLTTNTYTITMTECVELSCSTPAGSNSICQGTSQTEYSTNSNVPVVSYEWELSPSSAGSISGNGATITVIWSTTFTGSATLRAKGILGSCPSNWSSYLNITVNPNPPAVTINGSQSVCLNQNNSEYWVTPVLGISYHWSLNGSYGTIVSDNTQSRIAVNWGFFSGNTSISLNQTYANTGCSRTDTKDLTVTNNIAPAKPEIYKKGRINVLVCLSNEANAFQWYKDGETLIGATRQFYVARNNLGNYQVEITSSNGCLNRSNAEPVTTYGASSSPLAVYPNPGVEIVNIDLESEMLGNVRIRIIDSFGKLERSYTATKKEFFLVEPINIQGLNKGVYLVSVEVNGVVVDSQKLVVL